MSSSSVAKKSKKGKVDGERKSPKKHDDPIPEDGMKSDEVLKDADVAESVSAVDNEANQEPPLEDTAAGDILEEKADIEYEEPPLLPLIVDRHEGEKERGLFNGPGIATFRNGQVFKGELKDGKMHGLGQFTWNNGIAYEGDFEENRLTGKGRYLWLDGSWYAGDVLTGIRHGYGTFQSADGTVTYTGYWENGKRHGKGLLVFDGSDDAAPNTYEGDFVNNVRHGWGVRVYPSGNIYEGMWFRGVRHGKGRMRWLTTDEEYTGQWEDGVQHGIGQHIWYIRRCSNSQYPLRNVFTGDFVQSYRHGNGTFSYANGAVYQGTWKNNQKHGQGKFTFKNGRIYEGVFRYDRIVEFPEFTMDGSTTPDLTQIRTRTPVPMENLSIASNVSENTFSPSFQMKIDHFSEHLPSFVDAEIEAAQAVHVLHRNMTTLKRLYDFYSALGISFAEDNVHSMSRMQWWRLLKDAKVHQFCTLSQIDRYIETDRLRSDVHNPFDKILFRQFLTDITTVAFFVYRQEYFEREEEEHCSGTPAEPLVAWCANRLIKQNLLNCLGDVGGLLFNQMKRTEQVHDYLEECYSVFQDICHRRNESPYDSTLQIRDFMHILSDISIIDQFMTSSEVIDQLERDDGNVRRSSGVPNLTLEMVFLDFLEALIGCAEVAVRKSDEKPKSEDQDVTDEEMNAKSETSYHESVAPAAESRPTSKTSRNATSGKSKRSRTPSSKKQPSSPANQDVEPAETTVRSPDSPHEEAEATTEDVDPVEDKPDDVEENREELSPGTMESIRFGNALKDFLSDCFFPKIRRYIEARNIAQEKLMKDKSYEHYHNEVDETVVESEDDQPMEAKSVPSSAGSRSLNKILEE